LLARQAERSRLAETLRQHRLRLADLSDGVDEARLIDELSAFDPDAASASLAELERRDADLAQQEKERYAERDRLQRKRGEFESGIGAEAALQQRRNAEAELVEAARRWAVLKAASTLLGGTLERHRASRRNPLMKRAGQVFATLTGGAFADLDQGFNEDDEAKLEACRANGERAPVAHLSEATCDQLYLALRLAYIEDYAARAEAPPFIGDDLFASFDDSRTGAGLEALAAIGDRIQPILFTHHLHVIEEARVRLGDAVDIIRIG
jgi:chromosome segregation protein